MNKIFSFLLMATTLSANAQEKPALTPQPGKALVVFIRPAEMVSALDNWVLMADNEEFCRISNNRYVLYHAKPGRVNFSAKRGGIGIGKPVSTIDFELKEGEVYYVQCQIKSNLVNVRLLLNEITKRTAEDFFAKVKPDNCELIKAEKAD
jgi:hypothetical protein